MKFHSYILFLPIMLLIYTHEYRGGDEETFRETISREKIESSGIVRLSEIFLLIDRANISTTDGYRIYGRFNGLSHISQANWILFVDGTRFDIDFLAYRNLNLLPISLSEVDSVEVLYTPGLHQGEFNSEGIIHIHTTEVDPNLEAGLQLMGGNITGDPGPYKYTKYASENIDQIGPDYSIHLGYGFQDLSARLSVKRQVHFSTFNEIQLRNPLLKWEYSQLNLLSYSFMMDIGVIPGRHKLFVGRTNTGDNPIGSYGSDLVFLNEAATEIPSETGLTHASLNGSFEQSENTETRYRTKYSSNELNRPNGYTAPHYEWEMRNLMLNLELFHRIRSLEFLFGGTFESAKLQTGYSLNENSVETIKLYGEFDYGFTDEFSSKGGIQYGRFNGVNSIKLSLLNLYNTGNSRLSLNLAYYQSSPEERRDLWFWQSKGYRFLDDLDIEYELLSGRRKSETASADVGWYFKPIKSLNLSIEGFYRYFGSMQIVKDMFRFDSNKIVQSRPAEVNFDSRASNLGFNISISHRTDEKLDQTLFYNFTNTLMQSFEKSLTDRIPMHRISYSINYFPVQSLSIWSKFIYISESRWQEYGEVESDSDGFYNQVIEGRFIWDAAVNKWLWHRQIRLTLIFRNILNRENKYHPLGADFDLSVLLQVEFLFN